MVPAIAPASVEIVEELAAATSEYEASEATAASACSVSGCVCSEEFAAVSELGEDVAEEVVEVLAGVTAVLGARSEVARVEAGTKEGDLQSAPDSMAGLEFEVVPDFEAVLYFEAVPDFEADTKEEYLQTFLAFEAFLDHVFADEGEAVPDFEPVPEFEYVPDGPTQSKRRVISLADALPPEAPHVTPGRRACSFYAFACACIELMRQLACLFP